MQIYSPANPGPDIQDKISRGLGVAARKIGAPAHAYRPRGVNNPIAPANRFLRLQAAFSAPDGQFAKPSSYGNPLWHGVFDSAYTKPGDYILQNGSVWFIAAQQSLLPVLCVQTNRVISIARPAAPNATGVNGYGGVRLTEANPLIADWPASVLGLGSGGQPTAGLPADSTVALWTVLLPAVHGVTLREADLLRDDLGRTAIISAAELSDLGWRLTVKQATT
ncbi:MAG: hypothetical protein JOY71_19735 [Acetobacteraceae bacterium]|nr:hypothetical protein [Acetobacteraceae bacterium]